VARVRRSGQRLRPQARAAAAAPDLAGARSRAARGFLTHWLLVRGRGDRPLDRHVDAAAVRAHSSSKRPSVAPGERAILYAAVWQSIYGVVEITGEPDRDLARTRWAWSFPIRPLALVTDLERAPAVEEAGVFPQSLWRHSHIRLTAEQFERARALVEAAE
jgi:hypothetical protein